MRSVILRAVVGLVSAVLVSGPVLGVTKQACAAHGGIVKPSGRGADWWKCCLGVPPGILKSGRSRVCFVCKGEGAQSNCDQVPYTEKETLKPAEPSAGKDPGKPK